MDKKKMAAISGVLYYLRDEEETISRSAIASTTYNTPCAWALWGRQRTMQMRDLVQRRVLRR